MCLRLWTGLCAVHGQVGISTKSKGCGGRQGNGTRAVRGVLAHRSTKNAWPSTRIRAKGKEQGVRPLKIHVRELHQHTISHDEVLWRMHVCGPCLGRGWCAVRLVVPSHLCGQTARASTYS